MIWVEEPISGVLVRVPNLMELVDECLCNLVSYHWESVSPGLLNYSGL